MMQKNENPVCLEVSRPEQWLLSLLVDYQP